MLSKALARDLQVCVSQDVDDLDLLKFCCNKNDNGLGTEKKGEAAQMDGVGQNQQGRQSAALLALVEHEGKVLVGGDQWLEEGGIVARFGESKIAEFLHNCESNLQVLSKCLHLWGESQQHHGGLG